jgi:hypothetical protein
MPVTPTKVILIGIAAVAVVIGVLVTSTDEDYCVGRSDAPTAPVRQMTIPACTVDRTTIELKDLGARVVVNGRRLYLLDAFREAVVTTEYRFERNALSFGTEVAGYSAYRDLSGIHAITHLSRSDEAGRLSVFGDGVEYTVTVGRANGELILSEPIAKTPDQLPLPSSAIAPTQCADFDALTVVPPLGAVAVFHSGRTFHIADVGRPLRILRTIMPAAPANGYFLNWQTDYVGATLSPEFPQEFGHIERLENAGGDGRYLVAGEWQNYVVRIARDGGRWRFSRPVAYPPMFSGCAVGEIAAPLRRTLRHLWAS